MPTAGRCTGIRTLTIGGESAIPDEPFELSGVQVRAPGVFPQLLENSHFDLNLIDMKQINPTGRLSD